MKIIAIFNFRLCALVPTLIKWTGEFANSSIKVSWFAQVVQDIPQPIPLDIPMVLIKPQQACATAEVYKVTQIWS